MNKEGFTLLELLVVVLIIGILAAVALPQYRVAVLKARTAKMWPIIEAIDKAEQAYYLSTGEWAVDDISVLDIDMPAGGTLSGSNLEYPDGSYCAIPHGTTFSIRCYPTDNNGLSIERFFRPLTGTENTRNLCWAKKTKPIYNQVCKSLGAKLFETQTHAQNYLYVFD